VSSDRAPTLTVFVSGRRKQARIVEQRLTASSRWEGQSQIVTNEHDLAVLQLALGFDQSDVRLVLCRGFGLITGVRHLVAWYVEHGATVVDEWGKPYDLAARPPVSDRPASIAHREHVDDHPAVHPRGTEPTRAPALGEARGREGADRGMADGDARRSTLPEDRGRPTGLAPPRHQA
jgi:hypothetical protein